MSFLLTTGNVPDIIPVEKLTKVIFEKLYADKGYISNSLFKKKYKKSLTTLRSNMKNKFISLVDKILLRKRSIIETIND